MKKKVVITGHQGYLEDDKIINPCPMCGGIHLYEDEIEEEETTIAALYYIQCKSCRYTVTANPWLDEKPRKKWNRFGFSISNPSKTKSTKMKTKKKVKNKKRFRQPNWD